MTKISCVIINYNTAKFTINCLKSIWENEIDHDLFELIVVDNASATHDYELLKDFHDENRVDFKLIRSDTNSGFGGGNMLGTAQVSNSKYLVFINNDTLFFQKNTLKKLKHFMDDHPEIGVCSPQMLDEHKNFRPTIDHFSSLQREFLGRGFLELINPEKYPKRKKKYKIPVKANYVQGSFMFVRAEDFEAVGGFDTNLFLYYEESDLCLRLLKERNKSTYLYPDAQYIHFINTSTNLNKKILVKTELKLSLLYVTKKHQGKFAHQILLNYLRFRYLLVSAIKPSYFYLFKVLWRGGTMADSLRNKQTVDC